MNTRRATAALVVTAALSGFSLATAGAAFAAPYTVIYQYGGNPNYDPTALKWFGKGATDADAAADGLRQCNAWALANGKYAKYCHRAVMPPDVGYTDDASMAPHHHRFHDWSDNADEGDHWRPEAEHGDAWNPPAEHGDDAGYGVENNETPGALQQPGGPMARI